MQREKFVYNFSLHFFSHYFPFPSPSFYLSIWPYMRCLSSVPNSMLKLSVFEKFGPSNKFKFVDIYVNKFSNNINKSSNQLKCIIPFFLFFFPQMFETFCREKVNESRLVSMTNEIISENNILCPFSLTFCTFGLLSFLCSNE